MVAQVNNELLSRALLTPRPEVSDSDDVLLALETARALETQGEFREAARWLRRAAEGAEEQGNDERVLALARAAANLASAVGSSPPAGDATLSASEVETMPPPPGTDENLDAMWQPTTPPLDSFEPTIPPVASLSATSPPALPATSPPPLPVSATATNPLSDLPSATERSMRIGAVRVAIVESSIRGAKSFSVERLERGELPPPGTMEAMLVFNGESDAEQEVNLLAPDSTPN